jgi:hypothetical protein
MSELRESFGRLRRTGDYKEALRPLLRARLTVAGAATPPCGLPAFYARLSDLTGAPCVTASELAEHIVGLPGVTPMRRTGLGLIFDMDPRHDLLIQWSDGSEYLEASQVEWFRETVRRNPFLRDEE